MTIPNWVKRILLPLRSRKVRVALTTMVVAYAAEYGLNVSESLVMGIMGLGLALVIGIAHEDNGKKSGAQLIAWLESLPDGGLRPPGKTDEKETQG